MVAPSRARSADAAPETLTPSPPMEPAPASSAGPAGDNHTQLMPGTGLAFACPICFRAPPDSPFVTRCRHVFCYHCISTHLRTAQTCPTCGEIVTADTLVAASALGTPALSPSPSQALLPVSAAEDDVATGGQLGTASTAPAGRSASAATHGVPPQQAGSAARLAAHTTARASSVQSSPDTPNHPTAEWARPQHERSEGASSALAPPQRSVDEDHERTPELATTAQTRPLAPPPLQRREGYGAGSSARGTNPNVRARSAAAYAALRDYVRGDTDELDDVPSTDGANEPSARDSPHISAPRPRRPESLQDDDRVLTGAAAATGRATPKRQRVDPTPAGSSATLPRGIGTGAARHDAGESHGSSSSTSLYDLAARQTQPATGRAESTSAPRANARTGSPRHDGDEREDEIRARGSHSEDVGLRGVGVARHMQQRPPVGGPPPHAARHTAAVAAPPSTPSLARGPMLHQTPLLGTPLLPQGNTFAGTRLATVPSTPRLMEDPEAAADTMSPAELTRLIATLNQKLQRKQSSQRVSTTLMLLDFLRRNREEKMDALERLRKQVQNLSGDIAIAEADIEPPAHGESSTAQHGDLSAVENGLSASERKALADRRRRLSKHFSDLQTRYIEEVADTSGETRKRCLLRLTEDITKITQFGQLRCRATLMHATRFPEAPGADVFRASNIVSSIEFDRESEYLATAGVTKRIKIFEFSNIMRNLADVHFPVKEIYAPAKLSWVVWNPYIRNHMASSDYEGVVTLWDAHRGESIREYEEHENRAWSVDFCRPTPTLFASGSDDGRVKLWSTNCPDSVITIENEANVCSVKFNPDAAEKLAFGSAHYLVHYYDLRNTKQALHEFRSHRKTVSYVKFASSRELVSACADSTIKLWNLDTFNLERTFTGHTNDRHFVGLSVNSDYIACGSEENSVYGYYKAIPKPFVNYRFAGQDPLTGDEMQDDDDTLFVSSVCWCPKHPSILVAANSLGIIKVLDLTDPAESAPADREDA